MLVAQRQHQQGSSFISQSFLLNATTGSHAESKIFAPQYQTHVPLPPQYRYQLPYNSPPAPTIPAAYSRQQHAQIYPSHQERAKRQPSLKLASYASRTIPPMMSPAPPAPIEFDRAFLDLVKQRLEEDKDQISHHFDYCKDEPLREAAVLMPLCIVKGVPSVLFTIRSTKLRNHQGECSFPGGKRDPADESCLATALREMEEEIFISPEDVEVLGEYTPMPNKNCTMRVQPYIGFIKRPINDISEIQFNPDEVSKVFAMSIEELLNPERRKHLVRFRDSKYMYPVWHVESEACAVWGLTAFIMDGVLRRITKQGPVGAMICPEGANIQRYKPAPSLAAASTAA
ncbi:nudix (nucleoside diphosphate linked moiety X)-type motif 8 [Mortierella claussenii]|nr:nudix (nucleoside diphosphate linked moiety X)-type motif 8 [Mortierella claussenii]